MLEIVGRDCLEDVVLHDGRLELLLPVAEDVDVVLWAVDEVAEGIDGTDVEDGGVIMK